MRFPKLCKTSKVGSSLVGVLVLLGACGTDSTGPGGAFEPVNDDAVQSLILGMQSMPMPMAGVTPVSDGFGTIAGRLGDVTVTIDGKSETMHAIGLKTSFAAGLCAEDFAYYPPIPHDPSVCSPALRPLTLVLWQSHSRLERPDRMILITGEAEASDFKPDPLRLGSYVVPLMYFMDGPDHIWRSSSGLLTSSIVSTDQSCSLPLPPYAASATCKMATFDEEGSVVLGQWSYMPQEPAERTVTISRQTLSGVWQHITAVTQIVIST
jgi:hypothetical protein